MMGKKEKGSYFGIVKDVAIAFVIVCIVMVSMYAYTQVWPPMVVIESNSMEHDNEPYGRIGTINAGDLVFVKKVERRSDIITYVEGYRKGYKSYGDYGDVIVYHKNGVEGTPVIHRALVWVDVTMEGTKYTYKTLNRTVENATDVTIVELGIVKFKPNSSGFITRGDNNPTFDQNPHGGLRVVGTGPSIEPVKLDWIVGKAQGELPWFGAIKLLVTEGDKAGNVPQDSWVMLSISLALLIGVPILIDFLYVSIHNAKLRKRELEEAREFEPYEEFVVEDTETQVEQESDSTRPPP